MMVTVWKGIYIYIRETKKTKKKEEWHYCKKVAGKHGSLLFVWSTIRSEHAVAMFKTIFVKLKIIILQ